MSLPEFVLECVLRADVRLSSPSRGPAAGQVFGVSGPAGQVDWLLGRHWNRREKGGVTVDGQVKKITVKEENVGSVKA